MGLMKRLLQLCACAGLVFALVGCNFALLWDGIIGSGYYSVSRSTIVNASSSLSPNPIDLSALTTNSVIVYETVSPANDYLYGKMALTSAATPGSITIQFVTYNDNGTKYQSSSSTTIDAGWYLDLDTTSATVGESGTSDFQYLSTKSLVPTNGATFYVLTK
jgi:hypothetical protein